MLMIQMRMIVMKMTQNDYVYDNKGDDDFDENDQK